MERNDNLTKACEEGMLCELAFWLGKRTDMEKLRESYLETAEEVGCFSF